MEEIRGRSSELHIQQASALSTSEAALWGRLLDPVDPELSAEAAHYLLTLRFPQPDIDRMHELAKKARAGTLTIEEQIEVDNYERVGHVLSLMKSKARKALKKVRTAN